MELCGSESRCRRGMDLVRATDYHGYWNNVECIILGHVLCTQVDAHTPGEWEGCDCKRPGGLIDFSCGPRPKGAGAS